MSSALDRLRCHDIGSLLSFGTLNRIEVDSLPFLKGLESRHLYC